MKILNTLLLAGLFVFINCNSSTTSIKAEKKNGKLIISTGQTDLLSYQYETFYPPAGIDSIYKRSGFIHPLKTPSGKVLTEINPEGHWHHYGIWNPWTKVEFEADTIDFWNLHQRQGTVRFAGFKSIIEEGDVAGFRAHHEHVVLQDGANKVALNETQTVRVFEPEGDKYVVDFEIDLTPVSDTPFNILEHRYAGFGWRATEEWVDSTSSVLTSEGIDRSGADGSLARWVILQGQLGEGKGGAALLGHPENQNHPEPIRVWPEGNLFMTFFPTKFADWKLEPGNTYTLKYRMIVFDGELTAEMAEKEWRLYSKSSSKGP